MVSVLLAAILSGPIPAVVVRVLDGDTVRVRATTWPHTTVEIDVRVRGIDTPEKAPRAKCAAEADLAARASAFTTAMLPVGAVVALREIDNDKYGGRVVGAIAKDGSDLAAALIAAGLARRYDGGTKGSWCTP